MFGLTLVTHHKVLFIFVILVNVTEIVLEGLTGICTEGYFPCVNDTLCIPQKENCNGIADCPNGSDEQNCDDVHDNAYWDQQYIKNPAAEHDDLTNCYLSYNGTCSCRGLALLCHYKNYENIPNDLPQKFIQLLDFTGNNFRQLSMNFLQMIPDQLHELSFKHCNISEIQSGTFNNLKSLRYLYLDNNDLKIIPDFISEQHIELEKLFLMYNHIEKIHKNAFKNLNNLRILDLRGNRLHEIPTNAIKPLKNLTALYLQNNFIKSVSVHSFPPLKALNELSLMTNEIIYIEKMAFANLSMLEKLFLSDNHLIKIKNATFLNLTKLQALSLNDNSIKIIEPVAFQDIPNLKYLSLERNHFKTLDKRIFQPLKKLENIYFDRFEMCPFASNARICHPNGDGISSHHHLLDNSLLRASVWVMGAVGCTGNIIVILGRLLAPTNNIVHSLYLRNLALSDLLMGIYLFIIASVDHQYRGVYLRHQYNWRHSFMCNLCGFLSTLSCESSVLILSLVTWDRFIFVTQPLARKQSSPRTAILTLVILWSLAVMVSLAPLSTFTLEYFGDEFYGSNGVCLSLHIHDPYAKGWEYSAVMFVLVNTLALIFICYAYIRMTIEIRASGVACRSTRQNQERDKVAQRFGVIVFTDCLCWVPVIVVKLVALFGIPIPETIYAWLAVFILPINSALNPVLYTLTTTIFRKQIRKLLNSCLNKKNIEHHPQSASESAFSLSFGVFPSSRRILSYRGTQSGSMTSSKTSWRRSTAV